MHETAAQALAEPQSLSTRLQGVLKQAKEEQNQQKLQHTHYLLKSSNRQK